MRVIADWIFARLAGWHLATVFGWHLHFARVAGWLLAMLVELILARLARWLYVT